MKMENVDVDKSSMNSGSDDIASILKHPMMLDGTTNEQQVISLLSKL